MKWTLQEIALLREGKLPPNRTPKSARNRCSLLHIPLSGELLNIDMFPNKHNKDYAEKDLELLSNNVCPVGWSYELCRYVCRTRLHKKFLPGRTKQALKISERVESIMGRLKTGEKQKDIAKSLGISHQRVSYILKRFREINCK